MPDRLYIVCDNIGKPKPNHAMSQSELYTIADAGSSVPTMESFVTGDVTKSHTLSEYSTMDLGQKIGRDEISKRTVPKEAIGEPLIDLGIIDKEIHRYQEALNQQLRYERTVPRSISISETQVEWHTFLDTYKRTTSKGIDEGVSRFPKSSRDLMDKYHQPSICKSIIDSVKQIPSRYLRFMSKLG